MINITNVEDQLLALIMEARQIQAMDKNNLIRQQVHYNMLNKDIIQLKNILETIWTGTVSATHALQISIHTGIDKLLQLEFQRIDIDENKIHLHYTYRNLIKMDIIEIEKQSDNSSIKITLKERNLKKKYILHEAFNRRDTITEQETEIIGNNLTLCGIPVHTGGGIYKIIKEGQIECWTQKNNVYIKETKITNTNEILILRKDTHCNNSYITIGIQTNTKKPIEYREDEYEYEEKVDQRVTNKNKIKQQIEKSKTKHIQMNIRMRNDLLKSENEIKLFRVDTESQTQWIEQATSNSTIWSTILTIAIFATGIIITIQCYNLRTSWYYKTTKKEEENEKMNSEEKEDKEEDDWNNE